MDSEQKGPPAEVESSSAAVPQSVDGHQALLDELQTRRAQIRAGGGPARMETQHAKGKLTARERLERLLDPASFQEIDAYVTHRPHEFAEAGEDRQPGDSVVTGFGKINGRRVCIYAQDFTVLGGSFSEAEGQKVAKVMDLALQSGVPVLGLNDSVGARIQEGIYSLGAYAELFWRNTQASGVIPQISVMLGPCAGGSVYSPALTDFVIMTKGNSHMFITGPEVIKTVTHEEVDLETLGGAMTHTGISGVAHFAGDDEDQVLELIRQLLSYLPANNTETPPAIAPTDDPWRMDQELNVTVPLDSRESYNMKSVVRRVLDLGSFLEVHEYFAQNAIVGFGRLHGQVVGVAGQQPMILAGVIDIDAADKIARFVRFCDAFNTVTAKLAYKLVRPISQTEQRPLPSELLNRPGNRLDGSESDALWLPGAKLSSIAGAPSGIQLGQPVPGGAATRPGSRPHRPERHRYRSG